MLELIDFFQIFYLAFLIIYSGVILYDYWPLRGNYPTNMTEYYVDSEFGVLPISLTELILIIWVIVFNIETILEVRQMLTNNFYYLKIIYFKYNFYFR